MRSRHRFQRLACRRGRKLFGPRLPIAYSPWSPEGNAHRRIGKCPVPSYTPQELPGHRKLEYHRAGLPISGSQRATLTLRQHPQFGKDVYIAVEKGQLLESDYNDKVRVRFDEGKIMSFSTSRPSDAVHSATGNIHLIDRERIRVSRKLCDEQRADRDDVDRQR